LIIPSIGKCLDVSSFNFEPNAKLTLYSLNVPSSNNQLWFVEKINDYFFIKSIGNLELALTISVDGKTITLAYVNPADTKQQWKINLK